MSFKHVQISVQEKAISAVVHYPSSEKKLATPLIFVHGFVGSKVGEHRFFVKAARFFAEQGYCVVRFDFLGCGESDGDYRDVTFSDQLLQLEKVIYFTLSCPNIDTEKLIIAGHSLGGAVASVAAGFDHRVKQLLLWSPVANPYHDITNITGKEAVKIAGADGAFDYQGFYLSHSFFEDLKRHNPLSAIKTFQGSVHVLHSKNDQDVPKENAKLFASSLPAHQISYDFIEDADHTFSGYKLEEQLFQKSLQWIQSNLPAASLKQRIY